MLGTLGVFLFIFLTGGALGSGLCAASGWRAPSGLAPAIGLAADVAIAWGTVRLPGHGATAAATIGALSVAATVLLWAGRARRRPELDRVWLVIAAAALLAASLPFLVEGRFGILGTGLNPDMSQHLFAADRLADGAGGRLVEQGYPLGPHALVVAATNATGASLVHGFDGLTLAIPVAASLAPLSLLGGFALPRRVVAALLVGLPYMTASYLIQGAFKETLQALFVLAFAIALAELARAGPVAGGRRGSRSTLAAIPLAALAVGAAYSYSFPGLLWPLGAVVLWGIVELGVAGRRGVRVATRLRDVAPVAAVAVAVGAVAIAPEIGRMARFASFETFDPSGPGLGNLFTPISPLEALGIWPSGDFRLDPGDGAMPPLGFYLGEALGAVALAYGLAWWLRRGERAVPAALVVAAALFAYAHFAGTPYQAAKSIVVAAPLAMLIAARALVAPEGLVELDRVRGAVVAQRGLARVLASHGRSARLALAVAFAVAAAGSGLLALVNGPVGPSSYSPALTELRPLLARGSTLVLAPAGLLANEYGRDFLVWELRGGRVCVKSRSGSRPARRPPGAGIAHVVTVDSQGRPFAGLRLVRRAGPDALWRREPAPRGHGPCRLIAVGGRANPAPD